MSPHQKRIATHRHDGNADPSEAASRSADHTLHEQSQAGSLDRAVEKAPDRRIVRVEANFLRLPLFALDNKHMRSMDGIHCEGSFRRDGKTFAFTFIATRNARTVYPGPVARSAHFAILSFATERGLPVQNPIIFSWRELFARMNIGSSGKALREVKDNLLATKGLMIESRHALYSKAEGKALDTSEETSHVVGLYDELQFFGTKRKDGTTADINAVWLSRWYLDNLNALYSGPLDYELWRRLNDQSFIASRLYEFLFFKFYGGRPTLRFNYANLVKFIPARTERYLSDAKKQLNPALALLQEAGILQYVTWQQSRGGTPQLILGRGKLLDDRIEPGTASYDVGEEDFVLSQIQNIRLPEWQIVADFHHRFGHDHYQPSKVELETARDLIAKFGKEQLRAMIPAVVKQLKEKWPDAKTFVAATRYLDEAADEYHRRQRHVESEREDERKRVQEQEQAARQARERAALTLLWENLPVDQQDEIRGTVLAKQPKSLQNYPGLVTNFCLDELRRRQEQQPDPAAIRIR